LAKKYGILKGDESLDKMTLQQYLDLYKESLSEKSMEAILNLTEVAVDKEKKKKKKQKKDKMVVALEGHNTSSMEGIKDKKVKKKKLKKAPMGATA
jgi:hypothetical protein